jgi:exopolysaccharide production protein ExoQ
VMWMVFVLALILLYDLDENTLLTYNGLFWVLYVTALANLEFIKVEEGLCGKTVRFQQRSLYAAGIGIS